MPGKVPQILILLAVCGVAFLQTGCHALLKHRRANEPLPPKLIQAETTLGTLVEAINSNTQNVQQLDANVKVTLDGLPGAIKGTLLMEQPRKMKLSAGVFGINDLGVEIGSNELYFWIWTKTIMPGQQPQILFAEHEKFSQTAAGQQLGIQPKWIIEALGLVTFNESDQHEGPFPREDKRLVIRSHIRANGDAIIRDVVINPTFGWIEQVAFYSPSGQRLAYANALEHKYFPEYQAVIPRYVELHVTPPNREQMKLSIMLNTIKLNSLFVADETFELPRPVGVQLIDLSTFSPNGELPNGNSTSGFPADGLPGAHSVPQNPRKLSVGTIAPENQSAQSGRTIARDRSPFSRFR